MKNLWLATALILLTANVFGQFYFSEKSASTLKNPFFSAQKQFYEWSKEKDLSKEKGWKQFKRWEEYYSQRLSPEGNMPSIKEFLKQANEYNLKKQMKADEPSLWIPVGPDSLPHRAATTLTGVGRINCLAFHPTDKNTIWVGIGQGGIWKTTNSGESWMPLNNNLPILRISDIAVDPTNTDIMYVCMGDMAYLGYSLLTADRIRNTHFGVGVYKTTDGGNTWAPTGLTVAQDDYDYSLLRRVIIHPENTDKLIAAGVEGIWISDNAGVSWTKKSELMISDIERHPEKPNVLIAGTCYIPSLNEGEAGVLKSTDFGLTWQKMNSGIPSKAAGRVDVEFALSNPDYIYALTNGLNGGFLGLYQSTDEGINWTKKANNTNANIFDWYGGNGNTGQSTYDMVLQIHPKNENIIYAGGVNLWASENGGESWHMCSYWKGTFGPSIHGDLHQMRYNQLDSQIYVVNDGGIARTDTIILGDWAEANSQENYQWPTLWDDISSGMQVTSFYRLSVSEQNENRMVAGAQDNNSFVYDGESWTSIFAGDGMECIIHNEDPNQLWCSSQYGNIGYSNNGGNTFYATGTVNENKSWTTPYIYNYSKNALYAGFGNLYKSIDNGGTWVKKSNFPNDGNNGGTSATSALAQCSKDHRYIYLAKRLYHLSNIPSSVWVTWNEGVSWNNITGNLPSSLYFSSLAVDDDNPDIAWLSCAGFSDGNKVFKTTDRGETWTNISYNLPNIPVNSIVLDEETGSHNIYIGTDLGVYTFNDTKNDWEMMGSNMPNVIVSELQVHYSSRQLFAATFGRGIWKIDLLDDATNAVQVEQPTFDYKVFPNPNNGNFNIQLNLEKQSDLDITIINIMGSIVHHETIQNANNQSVLKLNKELPYGQYFLKITNPEKSVVKKFVVE